MQIKIGISKIEISKLMKNILRYLTLTTVGDLDDIMLFIRRFWKKIIYLEMIESFSSEHGGTKIP